MIVGRSFDGDDDDRTKWDQHDVYPRALSIIVDGCRAHVRFAVNLLEVSFPARWQSEDSVYDHRTLQGAHDILAAAWRYRTDCVQPSLPFPGIRDAKWSLTDRWLMWLRDEVRSWSGAVWLVSRVMTIMANQNVEAGYEAEDRLAEPLYERFADVPWSGWRASPETRTGTTKARVPSGGNKAEL